MNDLSCPLVGWCQAIGVGPLTDTQIETSSTTDGGRSWSTKLFGGGVGALSGVACPSSLSCVAVGDSQYGAGPPPNPGTYILTTSNGGSTWNPRPVPTGLSAVSCSSTMACVAVGGPGGAGPANGKQAFGATIEATSDGGIVWKGEQAPSAASTLDGVACPSTSTCVAVGQSQRPTTGVALLTKDGGTVWKPESLAPRTAALIGVVCTGTTFCVAVGTDKRDNAIAEVSSDGGAKWTDHRIPLSPGNLPAGLACASASDCIVVTGTTQNMESVNGGVTWTTIALPIGAAPSMVSCADASICWSVGPADGTDPRIFMRAGKGAPWVDLGPVEFLVWCLHFPRCDCLCQRNSLRGDWFRSGGRRRSHRSHFQLN